VGLFARVDGFLWGVFCLLWRAGDLGDFRVLGLRLGLCAVSGISHLRLELGAVCFRLGRGAEVEISHLRLRAGSVREISF
jgi:hypothetical protein